MGERLAEKVLLIGWDAADWKVINPLMDAGMMPSLEYLVNNGVMGNIATLDPPLSPMLWTSISTGKHADQHGILGFMEPMPEGKGVRPSMITSRKVKAIWNILTQKGFKTNVVGWWPSHPAEPINGISISNFYQRPVDEFGKDWPMAKGTVHPEEKAEIFKELRIHPGELTEAHIKPFVPNMHEVDQEKDKRLSSIAKITSECSTIHAAATYILENEEWDFTAVYYDAVDHYSHGFMNFHPPKREGIPDKYYDLYKGVVEGGYIYHDMMLGRLMQLAGEDTTIILMSDHGFHSDHLRPKDIPKEPAGPAWEHRDYGIFVMKGPGIKKDDTVFGTTLLDVTPTVLTLFGQPVGRDMEGKVIVQAFEQLPEIDYIESWEDVEGECGMHPKDKQRDPIAEHAAMQQLIELGYIEKPDEDVEKNVTKIVAESRFYLARVLMNKNKFTEALPILKDLYEKHSDQVRYAFRLAKCLDGLGRIDEASELVEKIIHFEEVERPKIDAEELERKRIEQIEKLKAEGKKIPDNLMQPVKKTDGNKREYPQLFLLKGTLELAKKNYNEALEYLNKAEALDPRMPQLHGQIGNVYLRMRRLDDAERAFVKALEIDPESNRAHFNMSNLMLRRKNYEAAAEYALNAVGLLYHFPRAHMNLGIALAKLEMYERAVEAFRVCLAIVPGSILAHKYLAYIYEYRLKDHQKADEHIEAIKMLRNKKKQDTQ